MPKRKYRKHSPDVKITVVRRHLIDHIPISDLCEEYKIKPSFFYKWQKEVFDLYWFSGNRTLEIFKRRQTAKNYGITFQGALPLEPRSIGRRDSYLNA